MRHRPSRDTRQAEQLARLILDQRKGEAAALAKKIADEAAKRRQGRPPEK